MKYVKVMLVTIIALIVGVLVSWGGLQFYKFFAPKYENVRREVFENTRSYNQAKVQELAKYRLEYLKSDSEGVRQAIASTIRHRFADFDRSKLPYELSQFLNEINR